jgi:protein TonB
MRHVRLIIFFMLSSFLHIAALFIFIIFFHTKVVITKPQLITVGVISQYKDPGVGSTKPMEPPKPKEPPKEESKSEKSVVNHIIRKKQEIPQRKETIEQANESLATQFTTNEPVQNTGGRGERTNETESTTVASMGSSKGGKGVGTQGSEQGGDEVGYPDYKINPKPNYPMIARRSGYEGIVLLRVFVLENGRVGKIELEKSSGYGILDKSAIDAVKDWVFIPGKKNGVPIPSWVTVPIRFELSSG